MTVVTNTSPLNYLVQIGEADTVASLYGVINVPTAVLNELRAAEAPELVRQWSVTPPPWLQVHTATPAPLPTSALLHAGETEAIQLARQFSADFLIMDELDGRAAARACGVTVIGTLGVLELAAISGRIDFRDAVRRL